MNSKCDESLLKNNYYESANMQALSTQSINQPSLMLTSKLVQLLAVLALPLTIMQASAAPNTNAQATSTQQCSGEIGAPSKLSLPMGKSTLINLPEALASRTVGNNNLLQTKLMSPTTLYILGVDVGSSNMILQTRTGKCSVIDVDVTIDPDPLQQMLITLMPEEPNIKVSAASDSLVLTGYVESPLSVARAVELAGAYVRRQVQRLPVEMQGANSQLAMQMQSGQQNQQNQQGQQGQTQNIGATPRIVNMLAVNSQQQVMLEVKVAEVSKTLLDRFGSELSMSKTNGSWTYSILSSFLSSTSTNPAGGSAGGLKTDGKSFGVDGQKNDGLIKILAEPSIMAISGHEGSFLAGGTIFIPVAQTGTGSTATITLEEKQFGVGVKFTPTVLGGGRINLQVAPEVSELNKEGVGVTSTGGVSAVLPAFTVRKASTTVQLMDGQTFAIGGLIKNNTTTNVKAFPFLGEVPILGALFRSTEFQKDRTELIFMVTPHLVKPINPADIKLPTDNYKEPTRKELILDGKVEGADNQSAPAKASGSANAGKTGFDQ